MHETKYRELFGGLYLVAGPVCLLSGAFALFGGEALRAVAEGASFGGSGPWAAVALLCACAGLLAGWSASRAVGTHVGARLDLAERRALREGVPAELRRRREAVGQHLPSPAQHRLDVLGDPTLDPRRPT